MNDASELRSHRRFDSVPIRQRLTDQDVARFAVERLRFPGVDIRARLARNYPYGQSIAHALGYVGGISAAELERYKNPAAYQDQRGTVPQPALNDANGPHMTNYPEGAYEAIMSISDEDYLNMVENEPPVKVEA